MVTVIHFANKLTGTADGIFNTITAIVNGLAENTNIRHVFVHDGYRDLTQSMSARGIEGREIEGMQKKVPLRALYDFYRFAGQERVTHVHCHAVKPFMLALLVGILLRYQIIFHHHGLYINNEYYGKAEQFLYKTIIRLTSIVNRPLIAITLSDWHKRKLLLETGAFSEVYSIPFGYVQSYKLILDEVTIKLLSLKSKGNILLGYVGRLESEKRFDRAAAIFQQIKISIPAKLVVFGDGLLEAELRDRFANTEDIIFMGYVPEVNKYIRLLQLVFLTSDREGSPLVIWEAMESGVPVLSTDVGGIGEWLYRCKCGLTFQKENFGEGVNKLETLLENHSFRVKLGSSGKKYMKESNHFTHYIKCIEEIYMKKS